MTKQRFSLFLLATFFILVTPFLSFAAPSATYKKIVFFGDSLSDNGNLYDADFGFAPASPPYFQGRFSNGYVWSDYVAKYFKEKFLISSVNYAVGGETAILNRAIDGYIPYSLGASIDNYYLHSVFSDRSSALYVIWIGANDYLPAPTNVDQVTTDVVATIKSSIESLINHGGKDFLLINLPDLSKTPYSNDSGLGTLLNQLTVAHNTKLASMVTQLQGKYKNINIHSYDLNTLFLDVLANPQTYNAQYHVNITDTTTACWTGTYSGKSATTEATIAADLTSHINKQAVLRMNKAYQSEMNIESLAEHIADSPQLREAYQVSKMASEGLQPCTNPDEHIFWDHVHPSAVVHSILSQYVMDFMLQNYPQA